MRIADEGRRRVSREHLRVLPGRTEIPFVLPRAVLGLELGLLIEHWRTGDGRLEAIRLGNRPRAHLTAIGPTTYPEPVGIGAAPRNDGVEHGHQVLVVTTAPVTSIRLDEILTVAV